jgi:hypothetical protein
MYKMSKRSRESFGVRKRSVSRSTKKPRYSESRVSPQQRRVTAHERVKNARIEAGGGEKLWLKICKVVSDSEPNATRARYLRKGSDILTRKQLEVWDENRDIHKLSGVSLQDLTDVGAVSGTGVTKRAGFVRAVFVMPRASKRKSRRSRRQSRKKRKKHTRKHKFDRA